MTARQQLARLLSPVLLIVLAMAGLRGTVAAPKWNGPLRGDGAAVGLILEVVLGVLLVITRRRESAARAAAQAGPAESDDGRQDVPGALRFTLTWVLGVSMVAIAVMLLANLHLHFFTKPHPVRLPSPSVTPVHGQRSPHTASPAFYIPVGPILYGLLIAALLAAVVISIWWSARLRRPAAPGELPEDLAEDSAGLRDAVQSGQAALAELDDARAAIIACYLAMERSLADRGTARAAADTPDELLARAIATGIVRGPAARRLTALFYEARFSTHPLGPEQRETARHALGDLAAELREGVVSPA